MTKLTDYPPYEADYPIAAHVIEAHAGWFCCISYPVQRVEVVATYGPYKTADQATHVAVSTFAGN